MDSQAPGCFLLMCAFEGLRFDTANIKPTASFRTINPTGDRRNDITRYALGYTLLMEIPLTIFL